MVGAYHLEDGAYDQAMASFEVGAKFARRADSQADEMLNQGYILIARLLASPEDSNARKEYGGLKTSFANVEHGESFVQQLDTALEVFSPQAD